MRRTTPCNYSAAGLLLRHTADTPIAVTGGGRPGPPSPVFARFGEGEPGKARGIADAGLINAGTGGSDIQLGSGVLLRPGIFPGIRDLTKPTIGQGT
jgi:hypothetical protein